MMFFTCFFANEYKAVKEKFFANLISFEGFEIFYRIVFHTLLELFINQYKYNIYVIVTLEIKTRQATAVFVKITFVAILGLLHFKRITPIGNYIAYICIFQQKTQLVIEIEIDVSPILAVM